MDQKNQHHIWPVLAALIIYAVFFSCPAAADTDQVSHTSIAISAVIPASSPSPLAAFSAEPRNGPAPLFVAFTDQSRGLITSWRWDFGDGKTSAQQNITHVYSYPGTYTVSLNVTGPGGTNTTVRSDYITVTEPQKNPEARFTQSTHAGKIPLTIRFTDRSRNNPTSYRWDFGDGSGSMEFNPSHRYTQPGYYPIRYTVTNAAGSDTAQGFVIVLALPHWVWWG
jgi:PKD repeat protein